MLPVGVEYKHWTEYRYQPLPAAFKSLVLEEEIAEKLEEQVKHWKVLNFKFDDSQYLLHRCVELHLIEAVRLLLFGGAEDRTDFASFNSRGYGATSLHLAAALGPPEMLGLLLESPHVSPFKKNADERFPVSVARDLEILHLLVEGAYRKNKGAKSHICAAFMREAQVRATELGGEIGDLNKIFCNALREGKVERWKSLNFYIAPSTTLLHDCVEKEHLECVDCLLFGGDYKRRTDFSSFSEGNGDGQTALHLAAMNGPLKMVELLLQNEYIGPFDKNREGLTPVAVAKDMEILNYLLQKAHEESDRVLSLYLKVVEQAKNRATELGERDWQFPDPLRRKVVRAPLSAYRLDDLPQATLEGS